jgi:chorismate dehydratase
MLRIGEISYLNCTPLFAALHSREMSSDYQFIAGTPAELNAKLRSGEIDLSPSSSIEYARSPSSYLILPDLSISSFGAVKSVMLFAEVPIEALDGATIALSGESATSVALLKVLLAKRYSFSNSFVTAGSAGSSPEPGCAATLLIGDSALRRAAMAHGPFIYDLGELWWEFTGLPFVFALWLLRRSVQIDLPGESQLVHSRLLSAKQYSVLKFVEIAETLKEIDWTTREFVINYWRGISYDLTPQHIAGLQLFYRYAAETGLIEGVPEINLLEGC